MHISIAIVLIMILSGTNDQQKLRDQPDRLKPIIDQYFEAEKNVQIEYSPDSSMVMCSQIIKKTPQKPFTSTYFIVYDCKTSQLVYKTRLGRSRVRWFDNDLLLLIQTPEIISDHYKPEHSKFLLNPKTGKRTPYSSVIQSNTDSKK
ncbi:MAG: hypothetical protein ACNS62_01430 [Candidatus Cyclobacteriaceae bacterium M3_2C_046]